MEITFVEQSLYLTLHLFHIHGRHTIQTLGYRSTTRLQLNRPYRWHSKEIIGKGVQKLSDDMDTLKLQLHQVM
jgi:hypothetical protein